ncbi:hypothetical protein ACA910_000985 [Epithemia clementina (nom. ined.)]
MLRCAIITVSLLFFGLFCPTVVSSFQQYSAPPSHPSTRRKGLSLPQDVSFSRSLHRHYAGPILFKSSGRTSHLHATTGIDNDGGDFDRDLPPIAAPRSSLFSRSSSGIQKLIRIFRGNMGRWMSHLSKWRAKKKLQSLFLGVVLTFTVLFATQFNAVSSMNVQHDSCMTTSTATQIERVQPRMIQDTYTHTRGGSLAETVDFQTRRDNDFSILRPKRGIAVLDQGGRLSKMEHVVEESMAQAGKATSRTFREAMGDLNQYMRGPKSDVLILLLATALITPLCKKLGTNPILGFLTAGMLLGPNGFGFIRGIHTTEVFAELGIVFFLFEMGIELSIERLMQMRKDVFGLGLGQFLVTGAAVAGVGGLLGLPANAQVVVGGGLALSSSAFVLQLLKDKNQLATRFGKASFGILLLQDLAVVPLLVVTPILAGSGTGLAAAVGSALLKAAMALCAIALAGRFLLNNLFKTVAEANSQEAFLGLVLLTVLSMSFMTEGLGLSNTLGAFLAGVLLSETKYRYQVEADIAPFRGILLGLFFVTVGYEIDVRLIAAKLPVVGGLVVGIMGLKAAITTALSLGFGLSLPTSLQSGLILSQGGEFAFVAFGLARSLGILDAPTTKLLLTSASLTMALTPLMANVGAKIAKKLEESSDFTHYLGQDADANEIKNSDGFAVVVGYGKVGKVVCNLLDRKLIKYVGLEIDPNKAIQARNLGLPVFYGDIARQEVAEAFNVGKAKIVIVCIADRSQATRVVIALRRFFPDLKIFCRAVDADHASRLQNTLNVAAMVPVLPEDTIMMTLPFGAAVMRSLGVPAEEVTAIIEVKKREVIMQRNLQELGEEAMLAQLGISNMDHDEEDQVRREQMMDKAAAERRLQTLARSPFVAKAIQDACPDSVCIEDNDEADEVVDALIVPDSKTAEKLFEESEVLKKENKETTGEPAPVEQDGSKKDAYQSPANPASDSYIEDIKPFQ